MRPPKAKKETTAIDYIHDPIAGLYRHLLPSAIGSLLTATAASLIDVVILSHFLGPKMLAVVGLCMPVYMLVNTLGMLIASGALTLYTRYLGEGDGDEAMKYFSTSCAHIFICGCVLTAAGLLFTGPVVKLLGANEAVFEPTMEYARVLFCFLIVLMLYVLLLFFVRVDNDPNRVLAATMSCAVTNLVLDILFVGPLHLGPKGAALATCLAYTVGMIVNLTHFISKKNSLKLVKNCLKGRGLRMWKAGLPLAASQLGMTVSTNIFNNTIIRAGGPDHITVYAIITQLAMTSMAIYDGVGQAAQPILAAATGAKLRERIDKAFRYGVMLELLGTIFLALLYGIFAGAICSLFSIHSGSLRSLAMTGIRIYALSIPFMGANSIVMYYFQAQEKTGRALLISLLSGSILLIAALLLLVACFGERGIWFSWVTAEIAAAAVSFLIFRNHNNHSNLKGRGAL